MYLSVLYLEDLLYGFSKLTGFIDILKELLFCHMFSHPKTYVMDVDRRKETEWHKLFPKVLKLTDLKYY